MNPNFDAITRAKLLYGSLPIIECSDEARALRYLEPRLNENGVVELVGKCWNPDVETWMERSLPLPSADKQMGDVDDFSAPKRLVDDLVKSDSIAKSVSVHNFTSLCSTEEPYIVHSIWPTPNKGYNAKHLLKILEKLRWLCFYFPNGKPRPSPLSLLGFATDSAGFLLPAAISTLTPTDLHIREGVYFLDLCVPDERFVAPYYSNLPFIAFLDWDHERREI